MSADAPPATEEVARLRFEVASLTTKLLNALRNLQESHERNQFYEKRILELTAERDGKRGHGRSREEDDEEESSSEGQNVVQPTEVPYDLFEVAPSMAMEDCEYEQQEHHHASRSKTPDCGPLAPRPQHVSLTRLLHRQKPLSVVLHSVKEPREEVEITPVKAIIHQADKAPVTISSPDLLCAVSPVLGKEPSPRMNDQEQTSGAKRRRQGDGDNEAKSQDLLESESPPPRPVRVDAVIQTDGKCVAEVDCEEASDAEPTSNALPVTIEIDDGEEESIIGTPTVEALGATLPIDNNGRNGVTATVPSPVYVAPFQEVVRDKTARAALSGACCEECRAFYSTLARDLHPSEDLQKVMDRYSRHRHQFQLPATPHGYWDMWSLPPDGTPPRPQLHLAPEAVFRSRQPLDDS